MACCIFAAMIIAHLISIWTGFRTRVREIKGWFTGRQEPTIPLNSTVVDILHKRRRVAPKIALMLGIEVIVLLGLTWHQFSESHHTMHNADNSAVIHQHNAHIQTSN